jgi:hypothetical protein
LGLDEGDTPCNKLSVERREGDTKMADTLNLNNDNVQEVEITRREARAYFDGEDLPENISDALDVAQGNVGHKGIDQYVVIKITA